MKIGMLTSGGDCQGLNAALRGVAKTLYNEMGKGVTLYGIRDGYRGLIEGDYHEMKPDDFSDILTLGGTILGTSRQPFKQMQRPEEDSEQTRLDKMLKTVKKAGFDCLVILGGNGTHKTANLLRENGVNVVTLPKTIDNDLWGTELTFGFQSAVNIASEVIDSIHSTAFSHSRVFIVEIMGHKAGWLTLHVGIASGADVIVIPEIPYSAKKIAQTLVTDSDGKATVYVKRGSYTLTATHERFTSAITQTTSVSSGRTVKMTGEILETVQLVVTNEYGAPLSGAAVSIGGKTITTGADGTASFSVKRGSYVAQVACTGYKTQAVQLSVTGSLRDRVKLG